ncbi:MAG: ParB/RepB/Spo0J family partition protein [Myxococcales bacterium]|nr:ParB/RepB/Spo0J family partition protein [Myxococcales bacterium]
MSDPKRGLGGRGLGRGLGALMPSAPAPVPAVAVPPAAIARTYFQAPIEEVYPAADQPRRRFDEAELDELAASIRAHGVIMPLVVRPRPGGGYTLIAGERRWRAAQRAGRHDVPVVIQDVDSREAFERALVENLQRADLNPIEEALAFQRLIDEFGLHQDEVAARVGKDRSTVANAVRLLKLPDGVRAMVEDRRLSMGHARALLGLDEPAAIETAARAVVAKGLSVRATESLVRAKHDPAPPRDRGKVRTPPTKSASARDLEERLTRALGAPVTLDEDGGDAKSGTLQIRYLDLDHLDKLLDKLLVE